LDHGVEVGGELGKLLIRVYGAVGWRDEDVVCDDGGFSDVSDVDGAAGCSAP